MLDLALPPTPPLARPAIIMPRPAIITPAEARGIKFDPLLGAFGAGAGHGARAALYATRAMTFDGTNDYLSRGSGLTGLADSKSGTVSLWVKMNGGDGSDQIIFGVGPSGSPDVYFGVMRYNTNKLLVFGYNTGGGLIVAGAPATADTTAASGWQHFLCSFDLTSTSRRSIYLNDTLDQSWTAYSNENIDHTSSQFAVGSRPNATNKLSADVADIMWWEGLYTDFSVASNRRLFVTTGGKPVRPAVAIAALGMPDLALYAPEPTWHVNKGGGGGFTENGALTAAATRPIF
jgi:hypothetical protein